MDAKIILKALKNRHWKDVFIPECKTGPTWGNRNMQRFDAWVMERSWVNLRTIGYEIKISRNDFLQDKKWRGYLPFCHIFYFICPWGLIQPEEIDGDAGLCWISKNGKRIFIKKWIEKRDIEIPVEILIHIIMSRTVVMRPQELAVLKTKIRKQGEST